FARDPLTLVIPFLITARAVSHSAQMHDRYYEELARGQPKASAIGSSFVGLFAPTMAGILTDALGVLAIGIVAIPALRQLAVTATLWLLSLIVTELLLNPIVYSRLRAPEPRTIGARETSWLARALDRLRVGVLRTIESFQRFLERTPVVGASFSLVDILKSMGQLFHELEPRWAVIPEEERAIRTMFFTYWGSVFPSTSTQYFTPDFATAPITFYCRD